MQIEHACPLQDFCYSLCESGCEFCYDTVNCARLAWIDMVSSVKVCGYSTLCQSWFSFDSKYF